MAFFDKPSAEPDTRPGAPSSLTGRLVGDMTEYIDTRVALARLEVQHSLRNALVGTLHGATMGVLALFFLIFLFVFVGLALNAALSSPYWGFGIVAGFFGLLTLLFVLGVDKAAFNAMAEKLLHNKVYHSEIEAQRKAAEAAATSSSTSTSSAQ